MSTPQIEDQSRKSIWSSLLRMLFNIRGKIIIPYLFLTVVVALVGIYVVTNLVAGSLEERLNNHLLESGRAVSNALASYDVDHFESARFVALTEGLAEALQEGDRETVSDLAAPVATTFDVDALILVDMEGNVMLNMLKSAGSLIPMEINFAGLDMWILREVLAEGDNSAVALRGIGTHPSDEQFYYFTAVPVRLGEELIGAVMIGTTLDVLLPRLSSVSLAEITVYLEGGRAVGSTFTLPLSEEDRAALLQELSISKENYRVALGAEEATQFETAQIQERTYRVARSALVVSNRRLGVFGVALPMNIVEEAAVSSRNTYTFIFTAAIAAVILVGYGVAQNITAPLAQLVRTSRAVAEGDLQQRTGIRSRDEIGFLATTFDQMTERLEERTVALQDSLQLQRETASRMRSILSSIGDGVLWEDPDGNFVPLNTAAESMLEEMSRHFLSGPMRELTTADQGLGDEDNPWLLERRRFQVASKVYTAHSATVGASAEDDLGTVIVLRDVTSEVEAEQLKDAFVAHVSHELRTPLTSIKGYTSLLLATTKKTLNDTQRDFLSKIVKQTDNLVSMINALLDFSEVEASGRLGLRQQPLMFMDILDDVVAEWQPLMEDKDLDFDLRVEAPEVPAVNGDESRLRWAVSNLVRNAWQYTPEGGSVTLRLALNGDRLTLDVIDTGIGIPREEQRRLFSRFYRVMHDRDDDIRGLGLGLYVTKAIIEAHGGYIQVVSEVGVGSTFTLVLPVMREYEAEPWPELQREAADG